MATIVLDDAKIYAGSFDLSGHSNSVSLDYGAERLDETTFGDSTRVGKGGLKTVDMSAGGFVDYTDDSVDERLFADVGLEDDPITILPEGETEGNIGYAFKSLMARYAPGAAVGELMAFEFEAGARGLLVRGAALHAATRTASGQSTARQLGAVLSTQRVYAALHVVEVSGTDDPTLDVVLRSDDNSGMTTPTSRITFTQATGVTSEWKELAGAITDDYWDIDFTIDGTNPSFRFIVLVAIQ